MPDAQYSQALLPDKYVVLGKTLLPFSLGHYAWLQRFDSPYLKGEEVQPQDLLAGIAICSNTWEGNGRFFGGNWRWELAKWAERLGGRRFRKKINWIDKFNEFESYLASHFEEPAVFWSADGEESGAPPLEKLYYFLRVKFNYSDSEIWDFPMALARWRIVTYKELTDGSMRFETDTDKFLREKPLILN